MSEKMTIVRWMPPICVQDITATSHVAVRLKEWVLPAEAVAKVHVDGAVGALLGLINELESEHVLTGNALVAARDYIRFKVNALAPGRIVKSDIK